jgi:type IV pilus assembly protein PilE
VQRRKAAGFTLIELMVVMATVAILASLAIPAYRQYVIRSHRSAAISQMMDLANREQQFLLTNRAYADSAALTANGYALPPEVSPFYSWKVTTPGGAPPSFVITFTPIADQVTDGVLTLDSLGNKTPAEKWQK